MKKRKSKKSVKSRRTGGMFIICLIILVAIIIIVNLTLFNEKNLNNSPKSGYKTPCNFKFGGVRLENICYDCGAIDGICPKDFNAVCKVEDPDCS